MRVQLGGDGGGLFVLFGSLVTMHALLMISIAQRDVPATKPGECVGLNQLLILACCMPDCGLLAGLLIATHSIRLPACQKQGWLLN